jgi:hypothetical protein
MVHNWPQRLIRPDVADGSLADLTGPECDFRFALESGLNSDISPCPKSADGRSYMYFDEAKAIRQ